jgi:hypothetical protein
MTFKLTSPPVAPERRRPFEYSTDGGRTWHAAAGSDVLKVFGRFGLTPSAAAELAQAEAGRVITCGPIAVRRTPTQAERDDAERQTRLF